MCVCQMLCQRVYERIERAIESKQHQRVRGRGVRCDLMGRGRVSYHVHVIFERSFVCQRVYKRMGSIRESRYQKV